jgi:hypothetical protein
LAEIKRICSERGSLDIKIESTSRDGNLLGKVVVKNIGTRAVELNMAGVESPLTIAKLELPTRGAPKISRATNVKFLFTVEKNDVQPLIVFSVLPGRTLELPFAARISGLGPHLISFIGGQRATIPTDDVCSSVVANEIGAVWAAAAIYDVQEDTNASK